MMAIAHAVIVKKKNKKMPVNIIILYKVNITAIYRQQDYH